MQRGLRIATSDEDTTVPTGTLRKSSANYECGMPVSGLIERHQSVPDMIPGRPVVLTASIQREEPWCLVRTQTMEGVLYHVASSDGVGWDSRRLTDRGESAV